MSGESEHPLEETVESETVSSGMTDVEEKTQEEEDFSFSDIEDITDTEEFIPDEETFILPADEETAEEESIEMETDDIFNDWIVDVNEEGAVGGTESPDQSGSVSLDEILQVNDEGMGKKGGDQVEDRITSSIASELLDEEMGTDENGIPKSPAEDAPEEGFIEMMEGLGFDRRTMLSDVRTGMPKEPDDPKRALNRKRYLESGLWFYRQGLYSKAMDEFKKVLKDDPDCVEASQYIGDTYFRLGQLDNAREAYEKVRLADPNNTDVMENLGVIFANQGDYKKAVWQWGEVLKRTPERKDIITRIKKMQRVIRQRYL